MTTETSNARGEWVLVPRVPTKAMIDAWRDAPDIWGDAYAAMLAAAPQPPSAPVGVDAPGSHAWMAEVCRAAALSLAAHGVRNDQLSKVADWIAQQPVAVDEAMVERAMTAYLQSRGTYEGEVPVDRDDMRAALTAALATQHREPNDVDRR